MSSPAIYIVMYIMYITLFTSRPFEALTLFKLSAIVSDVSVSEHYTNDFIFAIYFISLSGISNINIPVIISLQF